MPVSGQVKVDVVFHDKTSDSLKVVGLESGQIVTSGKVAQVTGTCATTAVTINPASLTYRDSAGELVTFTTVSRVAVSASGSPVVLQDASVFKLRTSGGRVAVCDGGSGSMTINTTAGTASYSVVLYGT